MAPADPAILRPDSGAPLGLGAILRSLVEHGVEFVICGGVACVAHGVARSTADLDCAVALEDGNLRRLLEALVPMGFRLRAPEPIEALLDAARRRAWFQEKHAMVATLVSERTPIQIDVFLRYPIEWATLSRESVPASVAGVEVRLSSIAHLLEAKRAATPPRAVDLRDIDDLEALLRGSNDGPREDDGRARGDA